MEVNEEENALIKNGSFKFSFKDVRYEIASKTSFFKSKPKTILKGISGEFRGNEMTAIIGLSGSGKTTLLDCLSGFRRSNVHGTFLINNNEISVESIKLVSSYFMQEQSLHQYLTVREIMHFSLGMKMKAKEKLSKEEKKVKIEKFLEKLNITHRSDTFIKDLSGGERKRLQIAVELVSDPKILFLDEPTTNLDSLATAQCIQFLKSLTKEQKTVICTIHQPSASVFKMFDHIYVIADGNCIYQGSSQNLIRFLEELNLPCPPTFNLADFILEIANNDYGCYNHLLTEKIKNGACINYRNEEMLPTTDENSLEIFKEALKSERISSSYFNQVYFLMQRMFLTTTRNRSLFFMRFGLHFIIGIAFGFIYKDIGKNGSLALDNYRFCIMSVSFLLYTSYHSLYTVFPLEFPIVKREHFNGWFSSIAYHSSMILFDAPIVFSCSIVYTTLTFWLTDQPLELNRYLVFLGFCLAMSYAAQSLGIMFTSLLNIQMTSTFGTIVIMPFFLFSSFVIFEKDTHPILIYLFEYNFLNMAFKGTVNSLLGLNRTKLECNELYCHYNDPKKILRDFEMNVNLEHAILTILLYYIITQIVSFLLINYRLKYRHS